MKTDKRITFEECVNTDTYSLDKLQDELIRNSFFLPTDVLAVAGHDWEIQPIKLCTREEWLKSQQFLLDYGAAIKYENGSKILVMAAKTVAVSIRRHRSLNEWIVLARLWVGQPQHDDCYFVASEQMPKNKGAYSVTRADREVTRGERFAKLEKKVA